MNKLSIFLIQMLYFTSNTKERLIFSLILIYFVYLKQDKHKLNLNKDMFIKHKLKFMYKGEGSGVSKICVTRKNFGQFRFFPGSHAKYLLQCNFLA